MDKLVETNEAERALRRQSAQIREVLEAELDEAAIAGRLFVRLPVSTIVRLTTGLHVVFELETNEESSKFVKVTAPLSSFEIEEAPAENA